MKSIAVAMVEPKPAGIGAEPPAPPSRELGVDDRRASALSDGAAAAPIDNRIDSIWSDTALMAFDKQGTAYAEIKQKSGDPRHRRNQNEWGKQPAP